LSESDSFANKFAIWQFPERAGETKFTAVADLVPTRRYFWHVRAADASTQGPWSATQVFRTPTPVVVPPPSPLPAGGSCSSSTTPLNIIECRRSRFPSHMSSAQLVAFLRASAADLNRAGVAGGPFGVLQKKSGTNCNGYSCDILCAGHGVAQRQYDVLNDSDRAQTPSWNGPHTLPGIRIDVCEIQ
jgi:hypothetical protein